MSQIPTARRSRGHEAGLGRGRPGPGWRLAGQPAASEIIAKRGSVLVDELNQCQAVHEIEIGAEPGRGAEIDAPVRDDDATTCVTVLDVACHAQQVGGVHVAPPRLGEGVDDVALRLERAGSLDLEPPRPFTAQRLGLLFLKAHGDEETPDDTEELVGLGEARRMGLSGLLELAPSLSGVFREAREDEEQQGGDEDSNGDHGEHTVLRRKEWTTAGTAAAPTRQAMTKHRAHQDPSSWSGYKTAFVWLLQAVACLAFLAAGGAKLTGVEQSVIMFERIGAGQWLRYLTGILEVIGAVLVIAPRTAALGSVLLGIVMIGAIVTHLFVIGGSPMFAIALLGLVMLVGHYRRPPIDQEAERSGLWAAPLDEHG